MSLKKGHEYWKRVDELVGHQDKTNPSIKLEGNQTKLPGHFQIGLQVIQPYILPPRMNNKPGYAVSY